VESNLENLAKVFCEKNLKLNLSSFKDLESIKSKNIDDSLLLNDFIDFGSSRVLDIGTGGGFPLLPLAITNPDAFFVGVDSVAKKLDAIIEIAEECGISNIETIQARVEELAHEDEYREKFDIVCSRAFAKLPINLELCLPFVKIGGKFVAMLGPSVEKHLDDFSDLTLELGANVLKSQMIKTESGDRLVVVFEKTQPTPGQYPRSVKKLKRIHREYLLCN
jgi:16S rRNA (guanine527-N7)-methyltransferase